MLYSWPDLFEVGADEVDDATQAMFTVFLGVMFGTQAAINAVRKISERLAKQVAASLPRQALTKGVIYPVVKKVATALGAK